MNRNTLNTAIVAVVVLMVIAVAAFRGNSTAPSTQQSQRPTSGPVQILPRMVDLGADKCIPCKQMAPIIEELKKEYAGRATIEFIDVWKSPEAGEPYAVRLIPTQVFFDRHGNEAWRHEGFLPKSDIIARLRELGAE